MGFNKMKINKRKEKVANFWGKLPFSDEPILQVITLFAVAIIVMVMFDIENNKEMLRKVHSGELELHCAPDGDWRMEKVPANIVTRFAVQRWSFRNGTGNTVNSANCITRLPSKKVY